VTNVEADGWLSAVSWIAGATDEDSAVTEAQDIEVKHFSTSLHIKKATFGAITRRLRELEVSSSEESASSKSGSSNESASDQGSDSEDASSDVDSSDVQFHFLCVSEAANAAAFDRGSISDVPNGPAAGLSNSIDFSKVGKEGFTEEKWNELKKASRSRAGTGANARRPGYSCTADIITRSAIRQ